MLAVALLMVACSNNDPIEGSWQLQQFAYGTDTVSMDEFDIVQVWNFTSESVDSGSLAGYKLGTQCQDEVMNHSMAWKLGGDTLYTADLVGTHRDTFLVQRLESDELVLVSMINDIPVTQCFSPAE